MSGEVGLDAHIATAHAEPRCMVDRVFLSLSAGTPLERRNTALLESREEETPARNTALWQRITPLEPQATSPERITPHGDSTPLERQSRREGRTLQDSPQERQSGREGSTPQDQRQSSEAGPTNSAKPVHQITHERAPRETSQERRSSMPQVCWLTDWSPD